MDILASRNPFHEATESTELSDDFDDFNEEIDGTEVAIE
jgi:hypothetical protein